MIDLAIDLSMLTDKTKRLLQTLSTGASMPS
jgi:hypothetical protein